MSLLSYADVRTRIGKNRAHLLLGNGFSIALDERHSYSRLLDDANLSERARRCFERLGTCNFEGVLRLLDDGEWLAHQYDLASAPIANDRAEIRKALIEAIARGHIEDITAVPELVRKSAVDFVQPYHCVFTTNYDLLLYWVVMTMPEGKRHEDGFGREGGELRFDENNLRRETPHVLYLHGALHLFVAHTGVLAKHAWADSQKKLTTLIREGLDERRYPLFVAEGTAEAKHRQIRRSPYLNYCLNKLARLRGPLVTHGMSFGANDRHLIDAIASSAISTLYVGLHGGEDSAANLATKSTLAAVHDIRASVEGSPVEIVYYESPQIWTPKKQ